jgi:hypothetical protein
MKNVFKACLAVTALALVVGCASAPAGPTDEELLAQLVTQWEQGLVDKDLDAVMAMYSESFSNAEASDKAAWKSYLDWLLGAGYLDGAEVDASGAETVINEGSATVGPLVLSTAAGVFNIEMNLAKEEGGWMIVGQTSR